MNQNIDHIRLIKRDNRKNVKHANDKANYKLYCYHMFKKLNDLTCVYCITFN